MLYSMLPCRDALPGLCDTPTEDGAIFSESPASCSTGHDAPFTSTPHTGKRTSRLMYARKYHQVRRLSKKNSSAVCTALL